MVGRSITDELHRKEMATDAAFVEGTNAIPYPRFKQYSYHISTLIDYESEQGQCSTKIVSLHSLFFGDFGIFWLIRTEVIFVNAVTAGGSVKFPSGVNLSIFTHFLCFFLLNLLKLGEIDGVKFLA